MNTYFIGTQIVIVANFVDEDGAPVNPATVTAKVLQPDLEEITLSPVNEELGQYAAPFTPTMIGLHQWKFAGGNPSPAAVEDSFMVTTQFEIA